MTTEIYNNGAWSIDRHKNRDLEIYCERLEDFRKMTTQEQFTDICYILSWIDVEQLDGYINNGKVDLTSLLDDSCYSITMKNIEDIRNHGYTRLKIRKPTPKDQTKLDNWIRY